MRLLAAVVGLALAAAPAECAPRRALEVGRPAVISVPAGRSVDRRFVAPAAGVYTFSTRGEGFDPILTVVDTAGHRLAHNDDISREDRNARVVVELAAGQEVHVEIRAFEAAGTTTLSVERGGTPPRISLGRPLPPWTWESHDIDGRPVSLADYRGRVTLIDFWATWCGPCMAELPNVLATYRALHDDGLEILGISLDDNLDALRREVRTRPIPWRQVCDGRRWRSPFVSFYGIEGIPTTVLLDREGRVVGIDLRGDELARRIREVLAETE